MMLRYSFDMNDEADLVEAAVKRVLDGGMRTADIMSEGKAFVSTAVMGDSILGALTRLAQAPSE